MNQNFKAAMLAASELTAAGNLSAATALIQRALAGEAPAPDGTNIAGTDAARGGAVADRANGPAGGVAGVQVIDVEARWVPDSERPASASAQPAQATPVDSTPVKATPVDSTPVRATPAEPIPVKATPADSTPPSGPTSRSGAASPFSAASPFGDSSAFGSRPAFDAGSPLGDLSRNLQSTDWQAFAADMVSKGAAFQRGDATQPAHPGAAVPHHGGKGSMVPGSFTAPAGSRDYLLYVPPGAAGSTPRPLVVMLHGCTQTPADFAAGTAMNALADRDGFVVLYPAQSKAANQSACWNWFNPRDQRAGGGEPSIIAGMVRDVISRHNIDTGRVSVAGLSAGGAMAAILADAYPDLFTAVAVHSGLPSGAAHDLPSALNAMKRGSSPAPGGATPVQAPAPRAPGKPVRTIVFHGRQDKTVHPSNGRQVVGAALAAWPADTLVVKREDGRSSGGRSFTRTVHADAAGKPIVEQWEVQGAGHAWSGGNASGSYTDPQGPDASAAMVAFFNAG